MSENNTRCLSCKQDFFTPETGPLLSIDCPHCSRTYSEDELECWAQVIWPDPRDQECLDCFPELRA